mgnify:CR=1 FL=1
MFALRRGGELSRIFNGKIVNDTFSASLLFKDTRVCAIMFYVISVTESQARFLQKKGRVFVHSPITLFLLRFQNRLTLSSFLPSFLSPFPKTRQIINCLTLRSFLSFFLSFSVSERKADYSLTHDIFQTSSESIWHNFLSFVRSFFLKEKLSNRPAHHVLPSSVPIKHLA